MEIAPVVPSAAMSPVVSAPDTVTGPVPISVMLPLPAAVSLPVEIGAACGVELVPVSIRIEPVPCVLNSRAAPAELPVRSIPAGVPSDKSLRVRRVRLLPDWTVTRLPVKVPVTVMPSAASSTILLAVPSISSCVTV